LAINKVSTLCPNHTVQLKHDFSSSFSAAKNLAAAANNILIGNSGILMISILLYDFRAIGKMISSM
jgi:hypothetical protein